MPASYYFWAQMVLISYTDNTMFDIRYIEESIYYLFYVKAYLLISHSESNAAAKECY